MAIPAKVSKRLSSVASAVLAGASFVGFNSTRDGAESVVNAAQTQWPYVLVFVASVAFLIFLNRDTVAGWFGLVTPNRVKRDVNRWLQDEFYSLTPIDRKKLPANIGGWPENEMPHFIYLAHDAVEHRPFFLYYATKPPPGLIISSIMTFHPDHAAKMAACGLKSDWRTLSFLLFTSCYTDNNLSAHVDGYGDASKYAVTFIVQVLPDEITSEAMFKGIHTLRQAVTKTGIILEHIAESAAERAAARQAAAQARAAQTSPPPPTQQDQPRPTRRTTAKRPPP